MARTTVIEFGNKTYQKWIDDFKIACKINNDKELASILGVKPSGYSHFKRTNKFPFERVMEAAISRGISLDRLFDIPGTSIAESNEPKRRSTDNANEVIVMFEEPGEHLALPTLKQNEKGTLKAFAQDGAVCLFDSEETVFKNKGSYLLEKEGIFYLRSIEATVKSTFILQGVTVADCEHTADVELSKEELDKFKILGTIEKIVYIDEKIIYS